MIHIVLYQPEIPPNTGNIIRLSANTGAWLHLIKPYGFDLSDRQLRRAGLDYDALTHVSEHPNLAAFLASAAPPHLYACSTRGSRPYDQVRFQSGDALLFGPETRGLPAELMARYCAPEIIRIPMRPGNRSLNLSNAVSIVVYEAWRQTGFEGAS